MTSRSDKELRDEALVFYAEDLEAINAIMEAFLRKSGARCALLVDQDGHMITSQGSGTKAIDLDTISALVAGSFAATKQLAHQFGEKEFTALFHQGRGGNIQLTLVGERALLTALFDDNTTVGMVRLYSTEAAKRLTAIFRRKLQEARQAPLGETADSASEVADEGFLPEGKGALDDIFGSE